MGLDLIKLVLFNEEQTLEFGTICARNLPPVKGQNILLTGDLGSGKTTFTRGLVRSLPGGNEAEISSPSFNICN
ncbi:MAG: tRNA (adenosine(37)-N6)-threonylcarbamoyltransferase complex ATPase subunit type 1 TsaE, partial [Desulfovibrionales bacterium]